LYYNIIFIFHCYNFITDYLTGGSDYTPGPYLARFAVGETSSSFSVNIINDNNYEGNEIFNLTINATALPLGIGYDNNPACVTIKDDECKYYCTHFYLSKRHKLQNHKLLITIDSSY